MKKVLGLVIVGALATGCASSPSMKELAQEQAEVTALRAEAQARAEADYREREQERMESHIDAIPGWALEAPHPDETGMYAVGMGESKKLRVALRKATLDAEFGLAKLYSQELSGSERSYTQDNAEGGVDEQYTALIDKLVDSVPLAGFEVVEQQVKPINGEYHAFVLLKLPYDEFNRVLQSQKREARDAEITAAFDDLERRLEKRRAEKRQDEQLEHERRLEEMRVRQEALSANDAPAAADKAPVAENAAPVSAQPSVGEGATITVQR